MKKALRDALDRTYYIAAYAPDFPQDVPNTLDDNFRHLIQEIENCAASSKKESMTKWLVAALNDVKEAYQKYILGEIEAGRRLVESAAQHLNDALSGRSSKPKFAVDSNGNIGEFTDKNHH